MLYNKKLIPSPQVTDQFTRPARILAKIMDLVEVDPVTGCWIWQGQTSGDGRGGGYPRMSLDGQTVAVHRVIATHFFGYVPGKKQLDHLCKVRACVSPHHLEIVTHKENQRRRDASRQQCSNKIPREERSGTARKAPSTL